MTVVLYTVQSCTWTNRVCTWDVEDTGRKVFFARSVKMQQVLEDHFAACSQCLVSNSI